MEWCPKLNILATTRVHYVKILLNIDNLIFWQDHVEVSIIFTF
jgi:hypothetical protein